MTHHDHDVPSVSDHPDDCGCLVCHCLELERSRNSEGASMQRDADAAPRRIGARAHQHGKGRRVA